MGVLAKAAKILRDAPSIATDTETTGLQHWNDELKLVALSNGETSFVFTEEQWTNEKRRKRFANFLKKVVYPKELLAHNWMFDSQFLYHTFPEAGWPERIWDTMNCEAMLTSGIDERGEAEPVSLDATLWRRFNIELDKSWQKWFVGKYGPVEVPEEVINYAHEDVAHLHRLQEVQKRQILKEFQGPTWDIEYDVLPVFAKMKYRGIKIDVPAFQKLFDNPDPDNLGIRQQILSLQLKLTAILTPHVRWKRMAKYDELMSVYNKYKQWEVDTTQRLREEWATFFDGYASGQDEYACEDWEERNWFDETPHPSWEGWTKGAKRYRDFHMPKLRKEAWPKAPGTPKLDESPIKLSSPDQVKAALADMGLELESTNKQTLRSALYATKDPKIKKVLTLFLEWRQLYKRDSSFGKPLMSFLDQDEVLHGNIKPYGTRTGRPSCEQPNLLQMPKLPAFRSTFIARPGYTIVRFDYASMELRIVAERANDQVMLQAFRDGYDLHLVTALEMYEDEALRTAEMYLVRAGLPADGASAQTLLDLLGDTLERVSPDEIARACVQDRPDQKSGGGVGRSAGDRRGAPQLHDGSGALQEVPEDRMRALREYAVSRGTSQGSGPVKQRLLKHRDAVSLLSRIGARVIETFPEWDGRRKVAKVFGFGILYGMGVDTLYVTMVSSGIDITQEEVAEKLAKWHELFAGASAYIKREGRKACDRGYTETLLGRRQRFKCTGRTPKWIRGKFGRVGANHCIQGSNADVTKLAMILAQPWMEELGGSLILQIYDELLAEVPEEHYEEAAYRLHAAMKGAAEALIEHVPIVVDGEVSRSWAGADPIFKIKE